MLGMNPRRAPPTAAAYMAHLSPHGDSGTGAPLLNGTGAAPPAADGKGVPTMKLSTKSKRLRLWDPVNNLASTLKRAVSKKCGGAFVLGASGSYVVVAPSPLECVGWLLLSQKHQVADK